MSVDLSRSVERDGVNESLTETVVRAVAEVRDVDPLDLEPLYDSVDPDALDRLFAPAGNDVRGRLEFSFAGCDVVAHADGRVEATLVPSASSDADSVATFE